MKTHTELEQQYKRVLRKAFPLLKFNNLEWNWYDVYNDNPYENKRFLRIQNAFFNAAVAIGHPFYQHLASKH